MANSALERSCTTCDRTQPLLLCPCCEDTYYCSRDHLEQDHEHHKRYRAFVDRALATMNPSQTPTCGCCGVTWPLLLCSICKVVYYCSPEHAEQGRLKHKRLCKSVEESETQLAQFHEIDHLFWTSPYTVCRERFKLASALRGAHTAVAAEKSLRQFLVVLRADSYYAPEAAGIIPEILIQLGRDQESYTFMRRSNKDRYRYNRSGMLALELRNHEILHTHTKELLRFRNKDHEDLFEAPQNAEWMFAPGRLSKSRILSVALIKTKLLCDISDLHVFAASGLSNRLPTEVSDMVRYAMVGPTIAARRDVVEDHDQSARIAMLEDQIKYLIGREERKLWEALFDHKPHRVSLPGSQHRRELRNAGIHGLAIAKAWRDNLRAGELFMRIAKISQIGCSPPLSIEQQKHTRRLSSDPFSDIIGRDYSAFE